MTSYDEYVYACTRLSVYGAVRVWRERERLCIMASYDVSVCLIYEVNRSNTIPFIVGLRGEVM